MKQIPMSEVISFCEEMDRVKGIATASDIAEKFGISKEDARIYMKRMTKKMRWESVPMITRLPKA